MRYLIGHLVEASAQRAADAVAVVDRDRELSYGELEARSNQLARLLIELGVRRNDRVLIYLEKSLEAVLAIYGILKAGAAYVPLDPQSPAGRLGYIARDAGARVALTGAEKQADWEAVCAAAPELKSLVVLNQGDAVPPAGVRAFTGSDLDGLDETPPRPGTIDADLAYILYTSGSTGAPKGVMLTHRNCLGFVEWAAEEFRVSAEDRLSSHAPLHFDLSTFDLYAAALAGAPVILVPPGLSVFPSQVRGFIESERITVWYSVPSILTMLVLRGGLKKGDLGAVRTILFAGEVFPTKHLRSLMDLLPHVRFANLYGPTETNVCTWWEVEPLADDASEIPIGRPIENVDAFAVTDDGELAGEGEVGELYVRGPTVMQGYLGDLEKTAARLVSNPFGGILDQPVYRTGDLVQRSADGSYRFLGRRDDQVKSRGYRIELGDVEAALYDHPAVAECAVVAVPDELITNRLEAYVVVREEVSKRELLQSCAARVPAYMIPGELRFAETLPRTSTGKVDRRALADEARAGTPEPARS